MKPKPSILLAVTAALILAAAIAQAASTDERIEKAARDSYVFKAILKDDHIKVAARDGTVTLTGTVAENANRSMAEDTVAALPGVTRVDNQLVIKEPRPFMQADEIISAKLKGTLLFHRSVSAANTKVFVKDGTVTLRGEAASTAEKDLATAYAKDIDGVKKVVNEMTISERPAPKQTLGEKIDDASITAQVKAVLLTYRSTSAISTKVETKDGIVTLTGKAKNTAEKDLVTKLVTDINGVKEVENKMIVEPSAG
ncbi:MAG: hypothetical protein PCFJNLEI_02999 [Verrucomicrobiae bacterium]|nr:hypothetical protein [Verrucomicrobiae bacterium]